MSSLAQMLDEWKTGRIGAPRRKDISQEDMAAATDETLAPRRPLFAIASGKPDEAAARLLRDEEEAQRKRLADESMKSAEAQKSALDSAANTNTVKEQRRMEESAKKENAKTDPYAGLDKEQGADLSSPYDPQDNTITPPGADLSSPYDVPDNAFTSETYGKAPQTPEASVDALPLRNEVIEPTWNDNEQSSELPRAQSLPSNEGTARLAMPQDEPQVDPRNGLELASGNELPPLPPMPDEQGTSFRTNLDTSSAAQMPLDRTPKPNPAKDSIERQTVEQMLGKKPGRLSNLAFMMTGGMAGENRLGYNHTAQKMIAARDAGLTQKDIIYAKELEALDKVGKQNEGKLGVAQINAGAKNYGDDRRYQGTAYRADSEGSARRDVATTQAGATDNRTAAMERNAQLRAQTLLSTVADTNRSQEERARALNELKLHLGDQANATALSGQRSREGIASNRNASNENINADRNQTTRDVHGMDNNSREAISQNKFKNNLDVAEKNGQWREVVAKNTAVSVATLKYIDSKEKEQQFIAATGITPQHAKMINDAAPNSVVARQQQAQLLDRLAKSAIRQVQPQNNQPGDGRQGVRPIDENTRKILESLKR